ncbi:hypothetical protein [uncultured Prochlorococcus sp.]|uniref:hypothetical protein n=1 Tax=uncultured Prochlorococcus sp. TaxID=159733 RepID=UPI00258D119A|nr:hypothetical protein [uncultured Prochlorococcus sp.]
MYLKFSLEAKKIPKPKWSFSFRKTHKDNLLSLEMIRDINDYEFIKNIDKGFLK